jgi:hypothetical protein
MGNAAARASAQALVASQISRMPEYQQRWIRHIYGDSSTMAILTCKIVGRLPKRG